MKTNLISEWQNFDSTKKPFIYEQDKEIIENSDTSNFIYSYSDYVKQIGEVMANRNKFHLGLLPIPFIGDIQKAKVFILMANPGFGSSNYKAEYECEPFRKSIDKNLHQDIDNEFPFYTLNPDFSWHGGFEYWSNKFSDIIEDLMEKQGQSYTDVLKFLAKSIAVLELIPYHSQDGRYIPDLPSSVLIREYVNNELVQLANEGKIRIIVTRKIKEWGLEKNDFICTYEKGQTRGASLSRVSEGGKMIISFLSELNG
jgi:hypothetical protein